MGAWEPRNAVPFQETTHFGRISMFNDIEGRKRRR